jgi:predicted ribosome quality control (RQC) complex YloA/Tae2 family protein
VADGGLKGGMTWAELARVAAYLQQELTGGHVQKIRQPRADAVVLECRGRGQSHWLRFSAHPRFCRAVVESDKPDEVSEASPFCMLLRKRLAGGVIAEIALDPTDRVVTVAVLKINDERQAELWTLVAELFGPQSNLLLLDPAGALVESLLDKRLPSRNLRPGEPYAPPAQAGQRGALDRGLPVGEMAAAFAQAEAEFETTTRRERLAGAIGREQKRLRKFADKLRAELATLPDHEQLTLHGQLLLAHLHRVKKGQTLVRLPAWDDPGKAVEIPLDPARNPADNADRMFKSARRNRRKREDLSARLRDAEDRLLELEEAAAPLAAAGAEAEFAAIEARLSELHVALERPRQAPPRQRDAAPAGPEPFVSADGARIFVGRSAEENDRLTFAVARGNDYWLHVEGSPGSHVVVKLPPSGELSSETLLDAASLAVLHSSLKTSGAGSVMYTRRKFLKKPKAAKAGLVYAGAAKSVFVRLDDARVKRLYDSRD